jgi:hypothetical protein
VAPAICFTMERCEGSTYTIESGVCVDDDPVRERCVTSTIQPECEYLLNCGSDYAQASDCDSACSEDCVQQSNSCYRCPSTPTTTTSTTTTSSVTTTTGHCGIKVIQPGSCGWICQDPYYPECHTLPDPCEGFVSEPCRTAGGCDGMTECVASVGTGCGPMTACSMPWVDQACTISPKIVCYARENP